jgi:two-component system, chemotaxis family, chemotaxis protein CheY
MGVCIVDDSEISREVVKRSLKMYDYKVDLEAFDGLDAIEKIRNFSGTIDLFVLDINMPKMNGLDLITEIRKNNKNTPIVMLTTETDKDKMTIAKERGATGWIVKPFDAEKFIKIVKMFIK